MYRRLDAPEYPAQCHEFFQFRGRVVRSVFCLGLVSCIAFLGKLSWRHISPTEFLSSPSIGAQIVLSHGGLVLGTAYADLGYAFRNIPYGKAGRWEEPRSMSWQGIVSTTQNQTSCMQPPESALTTPVEDCLKLNVFVPWAAQPDSELPVFVWFYGGAFMVGTAADSVPSEAAWHLVAAHRMIIVVPDTRLGAFGYLGSNRLRRNSTGNWGTLDQKLALSWVTQNIARFGGDPKAITIGGWSSGAAASSVLLAMLPSSQPLRGAIMMSGGFASWAAFNLKTAEETYDSLLDAVGCAGSVACQTDGPPCPCLLDVPAERLVNAANILSWAPIIDGTLLSAHPFAAFQAGTVKPVPIILGSCLDEGMAALDGGATPADFKKWMTGFAPPEASLQEAIDLYMGPENKPVTDAVHHGRTPAYWAMRRASADRGMVCVSRRVQRAWPAHAWQFIWESRYPGEKTDGFGPGFSHQSDQRFLFQEQIPGSWLPPADALHRAFAEFIHGHRPASAWSQDGEGVIFEQSGAVPSEMRTEQCNFWDEFDKGFF